jgi:hypothetical protein
MRTAVGLVPESESARADAGAEGYTDYPILKAG